MSVGSPPLVDAVDAFSDVIGGIASGDIFNVADYDARGDGLTDDGLAITAAAAALTAAGGGTLYFPHGNYILYGSTSSYNNIAAFTGLTGVHVISDGATLTVGSRVLAIPGGGFIFAFANCANVKVDGFNVIGPETYANLKAGIFPVRGIEFVQLSGTTRNVDMPNNKVSGLLGGLIVVNQNGGVPTGPVKNVHVGNLDVSDSWYGINGQLGPDGLVADNLRTDGVYRSYFIYGVRNHHVNLYSRNAAGDDALMNTELGLGLENITLYYSSDATSTDRQNGAHLSSIGFPQDGTPVIIANIHIHYNVQFPGSGLANTGGSVLYIRNNVGTFSGTRMENVTISGSITGNSLGNGVPLFASDQMFAGDFIRNFNIRNLTLINSRFSRLFFGGALVGAFLFENVYSDAPFALQDILAVSGAQIPPTTGRYMAVNSRFPGLYGYDVTTNFIGLDLMQAGGMGAGTYTIPLGWLSDSPGHTVTNLGAGGTTTHTLPALSTVALGDAITFLRSASFTYRITPNGTDVIRGGGAGKYASLDTDGAFLTLKVSLDNGFNKIWELVDSVGTISYQP